jgi:hypothetical protein
MTVNNQSNPRQGSRAVAGKSNEADGNLITPPAAEKVVDAKEVEGAHKKAIAPQLGHDGGDDTKRNMSNSPDACGSI